MGGSSAAPEHSASTIAAEEVTGSHVLTVDGYTRTKMWLVAGQFIRSATFAVAGHRWTISYYPVGTNADDSDYISLFLHLEPADARAADVVKAWFSFSLLDASGEPVPSYTYFTYTANTITCEASSPSPGNGWHKFIRRKALEQSPYLRNDSFRVRCVVTVLKETPAPPPAPRGTSRCRRPTWAGISAASSRAGRGGGRDVRGGRRDRRGAPEHPRRPVAGPPGGALRLGPAGPSAAAVCVWVEGVSADVFRAVLRFVYTDSLPELEDGGGGEAATAMARRLLAAADRYGLERLKLICEDRLCDDIDAGTVGTALELAERHGCQGLKRACLDYLMAGSYLIKAAIATEGFEHLSNTCQSVVKEVLDKLVAM